MKDLVSIGEHDDDHGKDKRQTSAHLTRCRALLVWRASFAPSPAVPHAESTKWARSSVLYFLASPTATSKSLTDQFAVFVVLSVLNPNQISFAPK